MKDAFGKNTDLSKYNGNKVLLVVNVASQCGFTNQYAGMQNIYDTYSSKGFGILAFPCNQFGGQEPGSNSEIQTFAKTQFNAKFPILGKIDVNGPSTDPVYKFLKSTATDPVPTAGWNPGLPEKDVQVFILIALPQ